MSYGFVGSTTEGGAGGDTQLRTALYTPTAGNSLLGYVRCALNEYPLKGYSGSGTPGDTVNAYTLVAQWFEDNGSEATFALTAAPSAGATSATLAASWAGSTETAWIGFSDGEYRSITVTNGSASISWTGGLAVNCTASVHINTNLNIDSLFQATNVAGTEIQFGFAASGNCFDCGLLEYSGIGAASSSFGAWAVSNAVFGGSANAITTPDVSIATAGMLLGVVVDLNGNGTQSAGTSPLSFTERTQANSIFTEDTAASANAALTASTSGGSFDTFSCASVFFPLATAPPSGWQLVQRRRRIYSTSYYPK